MTTIICSIDAKESKEKEQEKKQEDQVEKVPPPQQPSKQNVGQVNVEHRGHENHKDEVPLVKLSDPNSDVEVEEKKDKSELPSHKDDQETKQQGKRLNL